MKYRYREEHEMKDSGVEWLGKIPKDWEVKRNKYILSEINLKNNGNDENLLSVSEYYGVALRKDKMSDDEYLTRAESLDGYKICKKDDLVMNIMLAWKKAMGVSEYDGIVSPAYCIYRKKDSVSMKYYHYLFRTDLYANLFKQNSTGIIDSRLRLYPEKFLGLYSHKPTLENQEKIANFLDEKTSQFDLIISKKEALIQRLEEAKKSLISEVVTGKVKVIKSEYGYDLVKRNSEEMKDSGVEWLGEIPKDWEVKRIKYLMYECKGKSEFGLEEPLSMSQKYGLIKTSDMDNIPNQALSLVGNKIVEVNDLVFNKLKPHLGVFSVSRYYGIVSPDYAVYRAKHNTNIKYLEYLFKTPTYINEFKKYSTGVGAGLTRLYTDQLFNIKSIVPPYKEQCYIEEIITKKIIDMAKIVDKTKMQIEKLKEAKQSLISEAVTGKIEILD